MVGERKRTREHSANEREQMPNVKSDPLVMGGDRGMEEITNHIVFAAIVAPSVYITLMNMYYGIGKW